MPDAPIICPDELVERVKSKLASLPRTSTYSAFSLSPELTKAAAYVLILGAGFSFGTVPLVKELMHETIGGYYYPDQGMTSMERSSRVLRKDSASFWAAFNRAASREGLQALDLDAKGLPADPGAAYQHLFDYRVAHALVSDVRHAKPSYLDRLQKAVSGGDRVESPAASPRSRAFQAVIHSWEQDQKKRNSGEAFVKGFLRNVMDPGGEHGFGSTGRIGLNPAHIHLAALLEAQQLARPWSTDAFCRAILTTNFDTLLQNSLQMVNLLYRLSDGPERGFDAGELQVEEGPVHLVYVHGSVLRHNPASTIDELDGLAKKNVEVLSAYLESRDIIVIGYSGWSDTLMAALSRCDPTRHTIHWCDVRPGPAPHVARLLRGGAGDSTYVCLGQAGADGLMRALYEGLVPAEGRREPLRRYREWCACVSDRDEVR